jgi:transcriptional regulator with XRE-family HTH domain
MKNKFQNPTDKHVGSRVRMRRMMLGMSQEKLGAALDLTFQQVQKYEKGVNRIGAGRLQQIATILGVEVAFFFEGNGVTPGGAAAYLDSGSPSFVDDFVATTDGIAIARAFTGIACPKLRRRIADLVEQIAQSAAPEQRKAA